MISVRDEQQNYEVLHFFPGEIKTLFKSQQEFKSNIKHTAVFQQTEQLRSPND